ncbi:MAG: multicopper oxidase domain-containing protein, partial [Kiritimatiellia bacterium]
ISAWDTKYHYNFWRPITAIREAASDDNPLTAAITNWVPFVTNTPNFPSYGSAHSTFSAAAASVLSNFFGSDSNVFTVQPYNALVTARTYTNYSAAAREAGDSRILAGIHFPFDNTNALNAGFSLGNYISSSFLRAPADFVPDTDGVDTDGDGNVSNDYVNIQLSAGDGFALGADGYDFYCFGFADMTGVRPEDVMMQGMLAAEFSGPTFHFKEGQRVYLRLSNVGMLMRPDLFDPHTVHFHGFPNAAPIFDGEPMASISINMGGTLTYFYKIVEPGTFMYHCHVEATEHMEMGMLGNCYVDPIQNNYTNGTVLAGGFIHSNGYTYVYNDGDGSTKYDVAYPLQLGSFDRLFHERQITVQPLTFNELRGDYPLLNGRGYPDTVKTSYLTNLNGLASQKISSLITARQGQTILLRLSNLDTVKYHSVTLLGIPMKVVGQSARILRGPDPDGDGPLNGSNLYYQTSSITLGGGQSCDVLLDTASVTPGTYLLYSADLAELSNGAEDFGGMMTEIVIE